MTYCCILRRRSKDLEFKLTLTVAGNRICNYFRALILTIYSPAVLSSSISKLPMPPIFPNEGICMPPPSIVEPICVDEDDDELLIIEEEELIIFDEDPDIIFDMSPDIKEPKPKWKI